MSRLCLLAKDRPGTGPRVTHWAENDAYPYLAQSQNEMLRDHIGCEIHTAWGMECRTRPHAGVCGSPCPRRSGFCTKYGHGALRSGFAPNKGMRHFLPNGRRADQSRDGPSQEGGAATRRPPNGSRQQGSGLCPRKDRKGGLMIASQLLELFLSGSAADCIPRI